jgi:hypothetical protein
LGFPPRPVGSWGDEASVQGDQADVVDVHTPESPFECDIDNVRQAANDTR